MPHTTSAKKALRQSIKRRDLNRAQRSSLRTLLKKFDKSLTDAEVSAEARDELFREVTKQLDQSAAKHLIHKNKAARTKSRLAHRLAVSKAS